MLFQVLSEGELGFVGDYKPDLQVAQVLPKLYFGKGQHTKRSQSEHKSDVTFSLMFDVTS